MPTTLVHRWGAHDTDLLCVSGNLGAAYMGLQLLEREKRVFESQHTSEPEAQAQPDFAGREYLIERILKPEARRASRAAPARGRYPPHGHDGH